MRLILLLIIVLAAGSAYANPSTSGNCSPALGSQTGNAKIVIRCTYGGSTVQDSYLKATHPTKLGFPSIGFSRWFEDQSRPFLSIELSPESDLPAINTIVEVLKPGTSAQMSALKPFAVESSGIFRAVGTKQVTVEKGEPTNYPFLSLDDLLKKVHGVPDDFCPYDAGFTIGTTPEENKAREAESLQNLLVSVRDSSIEQPFGPMKAAQTVQKGLLLRIRYQTIFGDKITLYKQVFVNYARKGATATVWYPSKSALGPLQCITDEHPNAWH
ncbi:hypothetical protein [Luteibacter yeojuensis]|uniref:Uncharacterized protein n=1 Tax=Luteibacter yeojuensis TaxID=345309 RepID=A0A7X5QXP1_9GAMM|nr:hypothetical protein [Luteibacter yeojuensis]NID17241.1 hypothetical protein [Luteibacter yeojuensis]